MLNFKKVFLFLVAMSSLGFISANMAEAMPNLKLPYKAGESWVLTCGYGCGFHTAANNGYYSIDLDKSGLSENQEPGEPILAPINGTVVLAGLNGAFGYSVKIDDGSGYVVRVAHLRYAPIVSEGDYVDQGQQLGIMGGTGTNGAKEYSDHVHIQVYQNGVSVAPVPMSGYTNFVVGQSYTSDNYPDSVTTTLIHPGGWNYRLGHAFKNPVIMATAATITHQGQDVSISQAVTNNWIYRTAYGYSSYSGWFNFDIRTGSFESGIQYFIYSFVAGPELTLYGELDPIDRQAINDMDDVAANDSRFTSDGYLYSFDSDPDWGTNWMIHWMKYEVSSGSYTWVNQATYKPNNSIRYTCFRDPDTGQWTNWQRVQ